MLRETKFILINRLVAFHLTKSIYLGLLERESDLFTSKETDNAAMF